MNLGNKIIKLRKQVKWSQEMLADKLGVTRNTISNWELNATKPDVYQIKKMSKIFRVSIDELLDNDVRDIIEMKISNTENLTNKVVKITKIICITLYFLILFGLVGIIVYYATMRDFTDDNDNVIVCTIKDYNSGNMYGLYPGDYYLYIDIENDGSQVIEVGNTQKGIDYSDNERDEDVLYGEVLWDKIKVESSSYMIALEMLKYIKDRYLADGAVCRSVF